MATLNMLGPYPLTLEDIDLRIPDKRIGNYAYGHINERGAFVVQYVGRSDSDLKTRIQHGIGIYHLYKYSLAASVRDAFEKECRNYHDFGGSVKLDNKIHPDKPRGEDYTCPVEGCEATGEKCSIL